MSIINTSYLEILNKALFLNRIDIPTKLQVLYMEVITYTKHLQSTYCSDFYVLLLHSMIFAFRALIKILFNYSVYYNKAHTWYFMNLQHRPDVGQMDFALCCFISCSIYNFCRVLFPGRQRRKLPN
jgi:hypothetical protein